MWIVNLKRIFRRLRHQRELTNCRRISDYRATSLAVKLSLSGALQSCRRGVKVLPLQRQESS